MVEMRTDRSFVPALGFATAVSMWAVAYVGHLPAVMAPGWLVLALMLLAVAVWGAVTGLLTDRGPCGGLAVGATAGVLNLLILGSLLSSTHAEGGMPSAVWWIPGSLLVVGCIAAAAAAVAAGRRSPGGPAHDAAARVAYIAAAAAAVAAGRRSPGLRALDSTALFSKVAVAATFLLVVAGGLVTSKEAGLSVVDWPNTFGTNMFLYPLSRMTGGIYYEHAHRLFGSLVGLTTIVLALHLWRREPRSWVRRLALLAVVVVVAQGLLGGLRVTGHFTLSSDASSMAPNIWLAVLHGVLGQIFLGLMVAVATVTSVGWTRRAGAPSAMPKVAADRALQLTLLAALVVQLVLGAVQRHLAEGIIIHVSLAAAVTMIAVVAGARAWWLYERAPLPLLGRLLIATVSIQVFLGIAALAVTQGQAVVGAPTVLEVSMTTAHQACGAGLLALTVVLIAWTRRLHVAE